MSHPVDLLFADGCRPRGVVHVGASGGQELPAYLRAQVECAFYIEPIEEVLAHLVEKLKPYPNHVPIAALCLEEDGLEVDFNLASNSGMSSSVYPLGRHEEVYRDITYIGKRRLRAVRLDTIFDTYYPDAPVDLLVMDTQGSELRVLQGATNLLESRLSWVWSEVSDPPIYDGGCSIREVDRLLGDYGFRRTHTDLNTAGVGDALYERCPLREVPPT